jgi:NDP-sugar pyrophosphorylase family protein
MKTLVLAAGRSRRVKPIEDKNFLKFFGWTLIEHQLMRLQCAGFTDILLVGGAHNLDKLREIARIQVEQNPNSKIEVVEQKNLDEGMAGAILAVEEKLGEEDLFIVSSNDVVDVSAYELMKKASQAEGDSFLLATKVANYFPGGYLKIEDDRIVSIVEKPEPGTEPSDMVNVVLHLHKKPKALFELLKAANSEQDDRYEVAMDQLMKTRVFKAVPYADHWQPIKHPWHILDLMMHSLKRRERSIHETAQIAETAVIRGEVVVAEGVKVFDHAVIQGPAYIGKNSVVANNALVRESMIGDNCVVGFGTEVARSFIGDDCWFHSNYVGDTVMGNNVSFGAGAVCANLRLDEKEIVSGAQASGRNKLGSIFGDDIRVGVNTSVMPGVRIGSNSMIGSGLVVAKDIGENSYVSGKMELDVRLNENFVRNGRTEMKEKLRS